MRCGGFEIVGTEVTADAPAKPYLIDTRLQVVCRRSVTRARRRTTERGVPAQYARTGEAVVLFPGEWPAEAASSLKRGGLVSERTSCGKDRLQLGAGKGVWDERCGARVRRGERAVLPMISSVL